ncbi:MAG TPA: AgmX/PglI C-terminal domain-containing protein [Polyangiaceae bacterium]
MRRSRWSLLAVLVAAAVPFVACGGGTPPAKDADEAPAPSGSGSGSGTGAGDDAKGASAPADSSPPAASAASDATPAPAASAASGSGDIKVPGDDPWMAAHEMPPKDVVKTMRGANGKVQACFRAGLKRDPSTSGDVKLKFVITNDGAVRAWKDYASSMTDGDVTNCVGEVLNKLKFPKQKSPGDAWGTYTIHFGQ